MPIGLLFWIIFLLWFILGFYWHRGTLTDGNYGFLGGHILVFILLFLLGWRVFGFVIQG